MAVYRCISCGYEKESRAPLSCPECGYRMFKTPYERRSLLRAEIRGFFTRLELNQVEPQELSYFRRDEEKREIQKEHDDHRFPSYGAIVDYVCGAGKLEPFLENIHRSLEEIRSYLHKPFHQVYQIRYDDLLNRMTACDAQLKKGLDHLQLSVPVSDLYLPKGELVCEEEPHRDLLPLCDELVEKLGKLAEKVGAFIRRNNLYGMVFDIRPANRFSFSGYDQDDEYVATLLDCRKDVERVLAKTYVVDILESGEAELQEMMEVFWSGVAALRTVPVLKPHYHYQLKNGDTAENEEIYALLVRLNEKRYEALQTCLAADSFLADKTEEELFGLYDGLIELDELRVLGIDRGALKKTGKAERKLEKLIGLEAVKKTVLKIRAYVLANKDSQDLNLHMCFYGNPGTGKTEVARIIAGILHENSILPTDNVVEVDRGGLVGQYVGETPQKVHRVVQKAMGGVLFIDEAYALIPQEGRGFDYGHEAIATLLKEMEDHRGEFCVILAGYRNPMQKMLDANPGFRSRIQFTLDFPNYNREELSAITDYMLAERGYKIGETAKSRLLDVTDVRRKDPNFANAREVRNILEQAIMYQNIRCLGTDDHEIGSIDLEHYIEDSGLNLPVADSGRRAKVLTGDEELAQLVGLGQVKRMVRKIRAYARQNKNADDFNLHMCFYGNPGTGKTEVARILSRILYDIGVLKEAKLVETNAHGLIGQYVGETAPKTLGKINEAMNGILFIDEAYGLTGGKSSPGDTGSSSGAAHYGREAIEVLLKEMEDRRGQFCVILAGYRAEMQAMISVNPGLASRLQFTLEFPDYTADELREIARRILERKQYEIEDDALDLVIRITEYFRVQPNFANARTVRNILDQVIMNQNLRMEEEEDFTPMSGANAVRLIILSDVEDYLMDEGIDLEDKPKEERVIGFHR